MNEVKIFLVSFSSIINLSGFSYEFNLKIFLQGKLHLYHYDDVNILYHESKYAECSSGLRSPPG